ncbi:MAG: ATP-binding protein, partial [Cyanobacteriota bacterium]
PSATASATSSASATADSFPEPAPGPEQLEGELERLRHEERGQREEQERLEAELQGLERRRRQGLETLEREQALLQQLSGSSQTLEQRRQALEESHGRRIDLTVQLAEAQASLEARQQALAALQADQPEASLEQQQRRLEQEKEQLLSRRGQNEERCLSLGSGDPAAEQEQRLVAWEQARAERRAEEEQAEALQLLARLFEEMRSDLSHRYSEPLAEAITSYLQDLDLPGWATDQQGSFFLPTLNFDPRQGFADLRLREGEESFAFEQLSGGMREQLSGALRLAIAEVLKPAYDDVLPLIFDDAFTASDPERLEGVRRMIRRGSERGTQIILLSCTPADYAELVAAMGSRLDLPAVHASSA